MENAFAPFIDAWHIHNRIHLYLLDGIAATALTDKVGGKGRSVAEQMAHVHNVRLMWLKAAAPDLLAGQVKVEKEEAHSHDLLKARLTASADAIAALLAQALPTGKVKGFKPSAAAFMSYLIAHEAHHRGQILLALKQSGHPLDPKTQFGLWEWGVR